MGDAEVETASRVRGAGRGLERATNLTASVLGILNFIVAAGAALPSLQLKIPSLRGYNLVLRFLALGAVTVLLARGVSVVLLRVYKPGSIRVFAAIGIACLDSWVRLFNVQWFVLGFTHFRWTGGGFFGALWYILRLLVLLAAALLPIGYFVNEEHRPGRPYTSKQEEVTYAVLGCQLAIAILFIIGASS
jgi:hypothetical protein